MRSTSLLLLVFLTSSFAVLSLVTAKPPQCSAAKCPAVKCAAPRCKHPSATTTLVCGKKCPACPSCPKYCTVISCRACAPPPGYKPRYDARGCQIGCPPCKALHPLEHA